MWLLFYGHDPETIDAMSYGDLELFADLLPIMQMLHQHRGMIDG